MTKWIEYTGSDEQDKDILGSKDDVLETLIAVRKSLAAEGLNTDVIDALISLKVRELNPWMTLDEFLKSGFEGDCRIYLRIGYDGIGKFNNNTFSYRYGVIEHESITHVQPIHKPEPPR